MAKEIYVNLPVSDLAAATAFYEALGFTKNPSYSGDEASGMEWSDTIRVMLLKRDFYSKFIGHRQIADAHATSGAILCISMDSREAVQQFADAAKANGGDFFDAEINNGDMMFGYQVSDLDGHLWEPLWMDPNFDPQTN